VTKKPAPTNANAPVGAKRLDPYKFFEEAAAEKEKGRKRKRLERTDDTDTWSLAGQIRKDRKRQRLEAQQKLKRNRQNIERMLEAGERVLNDKMIALDPGDKERLQLAVERLRQTYADEGSSEGEALDNRFASDTAIADIFLIISGSESAKKFFEEQRDAEQQEKGRLKRSKNAATRRRARETAIRDVSTKEGIPLKKSDKYLGYHFLSKVNDEFTRRGLGGKRPLTARALRDLVAGMSAPRKRKPKLEPK
jgi:hypothetical protein